MSYSVLIIISFIAFYVTAVTFVNVGMKMESKQEIKIIPKIKLKKKMTPEKKKELDIQFNIENFHGRDSKERDIK